MTAPTRSNDRRRGSLPRLGALLFALCGACSDSPNATYPSLGTTGTGGAGGTTSASASGGASGGGAAGGGAAGAAQDAGAETSTETPDAGEPGIDGGVGPLPTSLCDPTTAWSPLSRIDSVPPDNFGKLGGVSGDELSVAFTSTTGDAYVADRSASTASFDSPMKINGATPLALDRVAFSPTGMSAIAIAADRHSFLGFERASRAAAWTATSGLEFTLVRAVMESDAAASNPVIGADKRTLFFIVTAMNKPTLYESHWDTAQRFWGTPATVTGSALESADAAHLRRPTGASFDGRTLFFYDEAAGLERGAWRASSGSTFVVFVDIGAFAEAAPTVACDTLYHQRQDATGMRLFLAD